ncbi:hypothetical protein HS088_TW13G00245 [Tripterygium wilfordii]|uniref:Dirigent protein n=2 Tax=Tripterygium wilfordii TaxID=458696 RepID=A0A7J7CTZ7_TRIWF|nr:hypothetical protein HS088_TW13G00245 [Tripterygium wilfordii]
MAKTQTISKFLRLFTTLLYLTTAASAKHDRFGTLSSRSKLGLKAEKLTHLQFYFHDIFSGRNPTAVRVAEAAMTRTSPSLFGAMIVFDDPLTAGPDVKSRMVGRAQGIYATASQNEAGLLMVMNFAFMDGNYNGSTLTVLGRNTVFSAGQWRNPTAAKVAEAAMTTTSPTFFGTMMVIDDPLTVGPDEKSEMVGRAQRMYASASQNEASLLMVMNFSFMDDKYNGSTLSVLGRNTLFSAVREMPILGGSGLFRFARDYSEARTHYFNTTTGDAIVKSWAWVRRELGIRWPINKRPTLPSPSPWQLQKLNNFRFYFHVIICQMKKSNCCSLFLMPPPPTLPPFGPIFSNAERASVLVVESEMGTREAYEQKLRSGDLCHDPTMSPGLGSPRCPRCLSLLDPNSAVCGFGGMLSAMRGMNTGIPFLRTRLKGPKWLPFVVGVSAASTPILFRCQHCIRRLCTSKVCSTLIDILLRCLKCLTLWDFFAHSTC